MEATCDGASAGISQSKGGMPDEYVQRVPYGDVPCGRSWNYMIVVCMQELTIILDRSGVRPEV